MVKASVLIYDKSRFKTENYISEIDRDDAVCANIILVVDEENNTFDVIKHRWLTTRPTGLPTEKLMDVLDV